MRVLMCCFFMQELVNEKLRSQQVNNELEKLTHELEKIGLNKEGLLADEETSDDRYTRSEHTVYCWSYTCVHVYFCKAVKRPLL